jgi:chorismate synthase
VVAHGVPPGLGTYAQWDERLDGLLAGAVMSLQAVKAVEIGSGIAAAASPGSAVHDEIGYGEPENFHRVHSHSQQRRRNRRRRFQWRRDSRARLLEAHLHLAPSAKISRFLHAQPVSAAYERSDVCVVPAAGVAAEAMVALTLARCALDKFGGDSMGETLRNFQGYCLQLKNY